MEDAGVQTNSENIESLTEIMDIFDLSDQDEELGEEEGGPCDSKCIDKRVQELESENQTLKFELASLKKSLLEGSLSEQFLQDNESFVRSLTSLPTFGLLQDVFNCATENLHNTSYENTLPIFKECLLTLMKIKMGVSFKDLATRFKINEATATSIFCKWLDILYPRFQPFVEWPHRDNLLCMRSTAFKHRFVSEVAIIIDVFDVYIEKPCLIETDAATYSEEKSRHTGKYLTAYIPQGMLIFVSSGWGGNTPYDDIVQKSGVLDQLLPGDLVMTQNGIMRLTDEKKLTGIDLRTARKVLELDMDYKRLFGAIRNIYSIFRSEEIPVEFLSPHANNLCKLDQIAMIAGCLYNVSGGLE